jgi:hypothetical protein
MPKKPLTDINTLSVETIRAIVRGLDGHTIYDPAILVADGLPQDIADKYTMLYKSDGTLKGSLTDLKTGQPIKGMRGLYGKSLLRYIAGAIGADTSIADTKLGRGSEAAELQIAIARVLAKREEVTV